jgi:transposase-like protein
LRYCGKAFCDHTDTFYHDLRKDEHTIDLALKMSMKGMSIEAIADVLEVQSASVKRWLARAAEQCDKVNDNMMKNVEVSRSDFQKCKNG